MEVDEQSDRDMQQLNVTEELLFAELMQNFDTFNSRSKQLSTMMSKRNGSSKTSPLYSIRTNCCVIEGIERSSSSRSNTSLVNRFDQARSHVSMDLNSRSDYVVTQFVGLLI